MKPSARSSAKIDRAQWNALREISQRTGLPVARMIRTALARFITWAKVHLRPL